MNITITGNLGSGKSSVCKELEKSGFTIISAGDIFRQIAAEKKMTVLELNEAAKKDRTIDDMLDHRSTQLGKEMDHTVFDSRLAWNFVENSFKVFLLVDTHEAARRVFAGASRGAENYQNIDETRAGLEERAQMEQERFRHLYGIDYYDAENYDLVIESTCATPEQVAKEIQRNFNLYQNQPFSTKVEMNLECLHLFGSDEKIMDKFSSDSFSGKIPQDANLCADTSFCLLERNGCYYLNEDYHHALDALAAGKVFGCVTQMQSVQEENKAQQMEQADTVHLKPAGYMVDFSKLF